MIRPALAACLAIAQATAPAGAALAQDPARAVADTAVLEDTAAFERGFAASFFQFDACGDALAGRMFRRALGERFAQCPFSPAARDRFQRRARAEQAKLRGTMERLVEANGGLPLRLEGMAMTCHEHQAQADYRRFRGRLEEYALGAFTAEDILPAECGADDILP